MGRREAIASSGTMLIGPTTGRLIAADEVFRRVHNFVPTQEGGLRSVVEPMPFVPYLLAPGPPPGPASPPQPGPIILYGRTYGVHHARLKDGQRDLMLLHTEDTDGGNQGEIWVFEGWRRSWACIVGQAHSPLLESEIPTPLPSDFPTQFVTTPTGVVIVPQGGRAYFYNGELVLPLGYDRIPGPPVALGPQSSSPHWVPEGAGNPITEPYTGANDVGYAMDGLDFPSPSAMPPTFRQGRIGTITTPGNVSELAVAGEEGSLSQVMGYLEPGRYRYVYRHIDAFGNLSPLSASSNDIRFRRQPAMSLVGLGPYDLEWRHADSVLKQTALDGIRPGREGTIGRIVFRTKDLENSGEPGYWEVPRDAAVNAMAFATLPDNVSTTWCDNIPDAWLVNRPIEVMPIPTFRLAEMAFGRLFIANAPDDEGALWWSIDGRWGTIGASNKLYPDPSGGRITALKRVPDGLLVFTDNSIYLVQVDASGTPQVARTVSSTVGCAAPSSIVTLRNGVTVWLAHDGFYAYAEGEPTYLWGQLSAFAKQFNRARIQQAVACFDPWSGEYRCWVSMGGSPRNDTCWTYDGAEWHSRDEFAATGVCTTSDHRALVVASGRKRTGSEGVYVIDHSNGTVPSSYMESGWIRSTHSETRSSIRRVRLWLRETDVQDADANKVLVELSADYRNETVSTGYATPYPERDTARGVNPSAYGVSSWGDATWRRRRPYWVNVDVDVPACEVFRIRLSSTRRIEVVGLMFEEHVRDGSSMGST